MYTGTGTCICTCISLRKFQDMDNWILNVVDIPYVAMNVYHRILVCVYMYIRVMVFLRWKSLCNHVFWYEPPILSVMRIHTFLVLIKAKLCNQKTRQQFARGTLKQLMSLTKFRHVHRTRNQREEWRIISWQFMELGTWLRVSRCAPASQFRALWSLLERGSVMKDPVDNCRDEHWEVARFVTCKCEVFARNWMVWL